MNNRTWARNPATTSGAQRNRISPIAEILPPARKPATSPMTTA
ncbi:MAG TPA: hypothetical protein VE640_02335 [Candidatus Bathyarchaeia archaeon]|nr:hypothetical protein [Candidatus Bathyarchaeia archaeon]